MSNGAITLTRHNGAQTLPMLEELSDVYVPAYSQPPYNPNDSIHSRAAFIERTTRQASDPGFVLIAARSSAGALVGLAFGLPFEEDRWWYDVSGSTPPDEIRKAVKFAVIELVVASEFRGQGLSTRLMDALLDGRPEPFAMLLSEPNASARAIYDRWGWRPVSQVQSGADTGVDDVLVLNLPA
jgi:GNAT superfamily N-acetyltransferase